MFRLAFTRDGFDGVGFLIGTESEIRDFLKVPGVRVYPNSYNPAFVS